MVEVPVLAVPVTAPGAGVVAAGAGVTFGVGTGVDNET